ncbi:undecaprenyl-diphosphatase UppP [Candidatus Curtissbacteria bacterium RIFCSPLOWO2_01_FULL_38_11b]|uniref:Undecaprenyl-diphosphatase n=1 Tax=Candidatus Curtissbacteria bacterium RIFCSPLOWO2_01_FULL_38_11b TaxID=1797725 RepID=A0A1F5GYF2_9BACT|nr:MAG: undecaprenyl-diphosphatase UppP [Candidatus Curtissbacteria bacterium RIFCSPLOWO2_01_FULL_38_11b]
MNYFLAVIAGAVQGLTEFLPISSTGHLIIFEKIFGIPQEKFGLAFDASLHLGTLLAVIIFFYKDYISLLNIKKKLLVNIAVGTVPAVFFGLLLENYIESNFREIWVVAASLILFSFVIVLAEVLGKQIKNGTQIKFSDSLVIGFFQAIALIPGVSRSGSTISAGLFLGFKREEAAKFAFILSGPIIAGAGFMKFSEATSGNLSLNDFNFFIIGILSSAFFGFLTIKYFLKYLSSKNLYPFIVYRIIVGLILLLAVYQ